jgi:UDP-N-acetylmuramoylalanine-D-glutamate ligase
MSLLSFQFENFALGTSNSGQILLRSLCIPLNQGDFMAVRTDFTELEKKLREHGVQNIVLFPDSGTRILSDESPFAVLHTNTMDEAVQFAYAHTPPGGTCLLSCASPSYSLWKNFEAKGDAFVAAVRAQAGV